VLLCPNALFVISLQLLAGSRDLLPPPPPAEKASASKDQAGKASTSDGAGDWSDRSKHAVYTDIANYVISPSSTFGIETLPKVRA